MPDPSTTRTPVRIVLSGGTGSGKSTVASRLRQLGAAVVEADLLGHEVLERGGAAYEAVAGRWPEAVVRKVIDREALAGIVFGDLDQLRELESMTHPAIAAEIRRRVEAASAPAVVVELPVSSQLAGPGWALLVVVAPQEERVRRALARGGDEADVRLRMTAQPTDEEWRARADHVVVNDGSRAELMRAVDRPLGGSRDRRRRHRRR